MTAPNTTPFLLQEISIMPFFNFIAGFFRMTAPESSTRLVGVACFFTGCFLAIYMVTKQHTSPTEQVVLGQCFTFGCIALGLRKSATDVKSDLSVDTAATPVAAA